MDKVGNQGPRKPKIAMIKVAAPNVALKIIDDAIQAFGAAGVSDEAVWRSPMPESARCVWRMVPTRFTNRAIARHELRKYSNH